jgi:pimeloyl-ACP methyl ester carboxylesterase
MVRSAFKSENGRQAIVAGYESVLGRAAATVPFRRRMVSTAFGGTHVVEAGAADGPPLLLLHGTASNSATWMADIPLWSRHYRVIAADIVGEPGLSEDRRLTLASEDASTWLASLLDELGVKRVRIVGMSLGGWIALHFATRFPRRVEALSLLAPSGLARQRTSFVFVALPLAMLGTWGMKRIQALVCGGVELPDEALAFMALVGRHFRPLTEPVPVFDDDELRRLQMPIQYFGGRKDVLLRSEVSAQRLSRLLPHAQVHLLSCGHVIVGTSDQILGFLVQGSPNRVAEAPNVGASSTLNLSLR